MLSASLLLAFSSMGHATGVLVDGTIYNGTGKMVTSDDNNPALRVMNVGEATWSNGILSTSGTGLGVVLVETNSTLNLTWVPSVMASSSAAMVLVVCTFVDNNQQVHFVTSDKKQFPPRKVTAACSQLGHMTSTH